MKKIWEKGTKFGGEKKCDEVKIFKLVGFNLLKSNFDKKK